MPKKTTGKNFSNKNIAKLYLPVETFINFPGVKYYGFILFPPTYLLKTSLCVRQTDPFDVPWGFVFQFFTLNLFARERDKT